MNPKNRHRYAALLFLLYVAGTPLFAQPMKQWDKTLGGESGDVLTSIQQTTDGGYILGGSSSSGISGDKSQTNKGMSDYWIVKVDANGGKQWDKTFGGNNGDFLRSLQQTIDGGYILGGWSSSDVSGDKSQPRRGTTDYWIVKVDANGMKQWDKTFGGDREDALHSLQQTADGGYILGGWSYSDVSGDKTEPRKGDEGYEDYWIVKVDASGVKQWDRTFGGEVHDILRSLQQTTDGGYILGGWSYSGISGDKSEPNRGLQDYWIVKVDASGVKQWDRTFGGESGDVLTSIQQTTDGGYILGGSSNSGISGDKSEPNDEYYGYETDYWIVKIDAQGEKQWDRTFGQPYSDELTSLQQTVDGGYILGGASLVGKSEFSPPSMYYVVKVDAQGAYQWERTFVGNFDVESSYSDVLRSLQQTADGGYILGGSSSSGISKDKSEPSKGGHDYWIIKLAATDLQTYYRDADGDGYGNPSVSIVASSLPPGYVANKSDCDDTHASVHPGAPDVCDRLDNNCNGVVDDVVLSVSAFTLVNAATDKEVRQLTDGDVIDLSSLPANSFNIRALSTPSQPGSVVFELNGPQVRKHTESAAPYALFSDNKGDYFGSSPKPGAYTLTATPYCGASGTGTKGTPLTIRFTVVYAALVPSFTLVNADTDKDIGELKEGDVIDLALLPPGTRLNIRANTLPARVGSVSFELSGAQARKHTENGPPYALFSDNKGDYFPWTPQAGSYTLTATPHSDGKGGGAKGTPRSVHFVVVNNAQLCTSLTFSTTTSQLSGVDQFRSVATGDFNGDSKIDVVITDRYSSVRVLLNNGFGGFPGGPPYPSGGDEPIAVATGDFNGDGKLDVVVTNRDRFLNNIGVLLNNGFGGFPAVTTYPSGGDEPYSVATGDFNGDGKLDIVVANNNRNLNNIGVLLNNGSGGFSAATTYPSGGLVPTSVATGDFNGDGKLDVVVAITNLNENNIGVLLNNGSGGFSAATTYPSGGSGSRFVATGDFNGDSKLDIVVSDFYDSIIGVLLNNGSGGFSAATTYPSGGSGSRSVATGDFNSDGKLDVVTTNSGNNTLGVLINTCNSISAAVTTLKAEPMPFAALVEQKQLTLGATPNPFFTHTNICYSVANSGYATLGVYNTTGIEVARLFQGQMKRDQEYRVTFESRGLPAGVYVLRLATENMVESFKVVLVR